MQGSINFDGSLVGNITGGGGGGGDTVVITPVVTSGTKIADVSVNGVEKDLYCPNPTAVSVTQVQQSGTKIATIGVNGVNTDIYTPEGGSSDVEITPVVTSGTKIADVSVGGVEKDLYTPDYGADITEIKQSLSDLIPVEKTASGDIVSFDDGSNLPMPKLEVAIEPVQSGSGDPSPTNIRSISGWDEVNVTRCGKNFLPLKFYKGLPYNDSIGNTFDTEELTDGTISGNTVSFNIGSWDRRCMLSQKLSSGIEYRLTMTVTSSANNLNYTEFYLDKDLKVTRKYNVQNSGTSRTVKAGFILNDNECYIAIELGCSSSATIVFDSPMLNVGSTPTAYEPYNGHTYTIDLDGTCYGGTLDVVSGVLTITNGYIASYNSEAIPSIWISDRDVYAEGTTPTVGAEVVYKLATPQTVQLTPTQVNSLLGVNNIWANTGDLELTYFVNNSLVYAIYDMINILTS